MQDKNLKQVIVVRRDLKMSKGKLAAQVAHAALSSWKNSDKTLRDEWEKRGAKKVVLAVSTESELQHLLIEADKANLPKALITDAGHTELRPGTITCLGIGPDREDKIDRVTGKLETL